MRKLLKEIEERIKYTNELNTRVQKKLEKYKSIHKKNYDDLYLIDWDLEYWKITDELYNRNKETLRQIETTQKTLLLKIFEQINKK